MGRADGGIAGYVRVSSASQTDAMQRAAIDRAARARGDEVATWYADRMSGGTLDRPELARCRLDVRAGTVRRLYVYRLDRLTRTGPRDAIDLVDEFRRHGCELVTIADGFDVHGPASELVLMVMAWCAKNERQTINERISAARARIEGQGGSWGRPRRLSADQLARIHELWDEGLTMRAIAEETGIPRSTIAENLQAKNGAAELEPCPEKLPGSPPQNH